MNGRRCEVLRKVLDSAPMSELPKDILEHLDEYEPSVDRKKIEQYIRGELSTSERLEVNVIVDGCKTWSRAYDEILASVKGKS